MKDLIPTTVQSIEGRLQKRIAMATCNVLAILLVHIHISMGNLVLPNGCQNFLRIDRFPAHACMSKLTRRLQVEFVLTVGALLSA